MKTAIIISLLLGQIGLLRAQDIESIKIEPPFDLTEGTEVELANDKLRPYKSWLESTKLQLTLLQESNQTLSRQERYAKFRRGIEKVLINADQSRNELFTRYVLKRALVIDNTLIEEEQNNRIVDVRLSLLEDSIKTALDKCESDLVYLNLEPAKQEDLNFIGFGVEYSKFLSTIARTILDSGAQYKVYRSMLGILQWDLYRDSDNKTQVANIKRIKTALESIPKDVPQNNLTILQKIRDMKLAYQAVFSNMEQVKVKTVTAPVNDIQHHTSRVIGSAEVKAYVSPFASNVDCYERNKLIESYVNKNVESIKLTGITEIVNSLCETNDNSIFDKEDVIYRIIPIYLDFYNMDEISISDVELIVSAVGKFEPYRSNSFIERYVIHYIEVMSHQDYGKLIGLLIETEDSVLNKKNVIARLTSIYVEYVINR